MIAREMQVEFERLIQLLNRDHVIYDKIDSDTIFYFLNAASERWIKLNYMSIDGTRQTIENLNKNSDAFKALIVTRELVHGTIESHYDYAKRFTLPNTVDDQFYLYLRSSSKVNGTYLNIPTVTTVGSYPPSRRGFFYRTITGYVTKVDTYPTDPNGYVVYHEADGRFYFTNSQSGSTPSIVYTQWGPGSQGAVLPTNNYNSGNYAISGFWYQTLGASYHYIDYDGNMTNITNANTQIPYYANVPNKIVLQEDLEKLQVSYFNAPILRQPCVVLESDLSTNTTNITVFADTYTNVGACSITYIRKPKKFNVLNPTNDPAIVDKCELSENVHQEIVELAVEMFVNEAAYRFAQQPAQN